jgi:hypothetical protein
VGEHADKSAVVRDDGSMAMKLTGRKGTKYDKFGAAIDTSLKFEKKTTWQ